MEPSSPSPSSMRRPQALWLARLALALLLPLLVALLWAESPQQEMAAAGVDGGGARGGMCCGLLVD